MLKPNKMVPVNIEDYKLDFFSEPLEKRFEIIKFIYAGADGAVLHIRNRHTEVDLALKVKTDCNAAFRLIKIEKNIASRSNLFVRCYGFVQKLPREWIEYTLDGLFWMDFNPYRVKFGKNINIFCGYFYEYLDIDITDWVNNDEDNQTLHQLLGILFEVFYANLWAAKEFGFLHQDLHGGNVMLKPYKTERRYTIADNTFVIDTPLIPKLIDFDKSIFESQELEQKLVVQLWKSLDRFINQFSNSRVKVPHGFFGQILDTVGTDPKTFKDIEKVFLSEYFDQFVAPAAESSFKRTKIECHMCGGKATRMLENRQSLRFCADDECVLKLGEIAHMI